jgi:hypothetical protein
MEKLENAIEGLKKNIGMLDAKNKNTAKSAALNQNPALAGQVLSDLEEGLNKLRGEHDQLKDKQDRDSRQLFQELDNKADK